MTKKKPLKTADGKTIKAGMTVVQIHTKDGGKTWGVGLEQEVYIASGGPLGSVKLAEPFWHATLMGDNRIFADNKTAKAECKRRNKAVKAAK